MVKYVDVAEKIGSPSALVEELGDIIRNEIVTSIENKEVICLDFANIQSMISPFLNRAIGKLYESYTSEQISSYLELKNFPETKKSTLNLVIRNAKKYYSNKDLYEKAMKEVIDIE